MALTLWIAVFVAAFVMGYPIALAMIISSALYLLTSELDLAILMDQMVIKFENQFVLLAVPLFIFTAKIMNASKITDRIFNFAKSLVGSLKGGLGHVNVIASIIFAGMTGSEIADVAGLGAIEIKAMKDEGFDGPFSCAVTCASATIGPIIPPSIPMVIYSLFSGASLGYLFLGGFIPGLVLGLTLMALIYFISVSVKRNYPRGVKTGFREFVGSFSDSFFALMAPVILLAGIYGGIFTATEAAGVVAVYSLILALFVYRTLGLKELYKVFVDTVVTTGFVSIMIPGAFIFGYVVAREGIPAMITDAFINLGLMSSKWMVLLSLNVLFIVLGCFINVSTILLIIIPIVLPLVEAAGIDLVHFGVVAVFNLMIALDTPPYGPTLFITITSSMSGTPLSEVMKEMIIFIVFEIVALMMVTFIPALVLWLPRLAGYRG